MEWIGMECHGFGGNRIERTVLEQSEPEFIRTDWGGTDYSGLGRIGLGRIGLEWIGLERNELH